MKKDYTDVYRSVKMLDKLEFDPIATLVSQYRAIENEIQRQEQIKNGRIVEMNLNGKPKAYRPDYHMGLYDKLTNISGQLLRYGYARIPETVTSVQKEIPPLVINLTK